MSGAELAGIGGAIAIIGAVLFAAAWAFSVVLGNPLAGGVDVARWIAVPAHICLLLGLVAIYGVQSAETGVWGLVGFLLAFSGMAIFIGYVIGGWTPAIPEPTLGPIGGGLWLVGLLILAVVTWQGGVLPQWSGVVWMLGALTYVSSVPDGPDDPPTLVALVGASAFAVGIGWAGVAIVSL
ncbi:MAG: hypothetical protein R3258_08205 [Acidimicrobiia bacterium]|nr:hypothetical protein [Acidimicrobiia bacterium]